MKKDKFNKNKTFGVPENYFDDFQGRLFEKIEELEETTILNSIKKSGDGFKVPDSYFEKTQDRILERTIDLNKVVGLFSSIPLRYITGIAASLIICLIGYSIFVDVENDPQLVFEDVQTYLNNDLTDYSSYELAELLQLESDELNNLNTLNFQDETVIDYLADQTDSYESLFDETTLNDVD